MIRKIVFTGFLLLQLNNGFCQYLFFKDFSLYNPAYTGVPDKKNITFATLEEHSENQYWDYTVGRLDINIPVKKIYSGFGLHALYDKMGIFSSTDLGLKYSFNYAFSKDFILSAGSYFSIYIDKIKGELPFSDEFFNFQTTNVNETNYMFNIDIGLWLKFKNIQLGVTNQHINKPSYNLVIGNHTNQVKIINNFNGILNYDFSLGNNFKLSNSIFIRDLESFSENKNLYINNLLEIKHVFFIGVTSHLYKYDVIKGYLSPIFGFNLNDTFEFLISAELIRINASKTNSKTIEGILTFNF